MIDRLKRAIIDAFRPASSGRSVHHDEHALQLATAVLMVEIMRADHKLAIAEEDKIMELARHRFGLDEEETAALLEMARAESEMAVSLHAFTRRITDGLDVDERGQVMELLWEIAYADGRIDMYEEHLVRRIADLLYVPHADFIRAKHRAAKRMAQGTSDS